MNNLSRSAGLFALGLWVFLAGVPAAAQAMEGIEPEEDIADLLPEKFPSPEEAETIPERRWAVLPQVGYGPDAGRVFINTQDLKNESSLDSSIISRIIEDFQYSYGAGLRIALSQSLVARIDVGFSREETGLIYLSFGQTF